MRRALRLAAPPAVVVLLAIAGWQLLVWTWQPPPFLLPGPAQVAEAAWARRSALAWATLGTAASAASGFALAALLGIGAGSVLGSIRILERGFYPLATLLQMVPLVAIAPLLVVWFGYGTGSTIASAAIVALFPVLANTLDGLRSVDPGLRELFRMHRAGPFARWWKLGLPAATPSIVTGLRIAAGLAVIGAVVGEFVAGYAGERAPLGIVIMAAMREGATDLVMAAVALSALVGFLLFGVVSAIGWISLRRWHASAQPA
ncbi:MAG: ABC transporter permease [Phycisphaerales bacterium]